MDSSHLPRNLEEELECLQREDIIELIQFTDWQFQAHSEQASKLDKCLIPKIEDLFTQMAGGKSWICPGYVASNQLIVLEESSRDYVVINTHWGLFRYKRLPFGVSSASGIFQRVMESILKGIPGVTVYIDDILVTATADEEHLASLDETLTEAGLRLRRDKCKFLAPLVEYLGYLIDVEGLHPTKEKVRAIQDAPNKQFGIDQVLPRTPDMQLQVSTKLVNRVLSAIKDRFIIYCAVKCN